MKTTKTTQLKITGMTCNMCVQHVTKALQSVVGVQGTMVNLQSGTAIVQHAEDAEPEAMIEAVVEAGYEVQVIKGSGAADATPGINRTAEQSIS